MTRFSLTEEGQAKWSIVLAVTFASFVGALSSTLIDVVIPEMMGELGMPLERAHWLATGFLLANTVSLLLTATAIRVVGLQCTYLIGIGVFGAGAILGCVVSNDFLLIFARVIQGAGSGLLGPVAFIAISQIYPPHRRGFAMGIVGAGVLMGPTLGPLFGAVLVDTIGWRWTYAAQVPLAVACLYLGKSLRMFRAEGDARVSFDTHGFLSLCIWVSALLLMLSLSSVYSLSDPLMPALCGVLVISFAYFIRREMREDDPLVAVGLLLVPRFALANLMAFAIGFALYGSLLLIPLYLQSVLGLSATTSGLVLLPAGLIMVALSPLGGHLSDVISPRVVISVGMCGFAISVGMMASLGPHTSFTELVIAVCCGRAALACLLPSLYSAAFRCLPTTAIPQAAGITNFSRQLGGTLGVAGASVFLSDRIATHWQAFIGDLDIANLARSVVADTWTTEQVALSQGRLWASTYGYREVLLYVAVGVAIAGIAGLFMGGSRTATLKATREERVIESDQSGS